MLFFAWTVSKMFDELEVKISVVVQCVKATHAFISVTGSCSLMIEHSVFPVMAGLIVEVLFMLFSVYSTV